MFQAMTQDSTTHEEKSSKSYWGFVLWPVVAIAITLVLKATSVAVAGLPTDNPRYLAFRREMLPKVGSKITSVGKLQPRKLGWWLASGEWGFYLYATTTNQVDLDKQNALNRFTNRMVEVVGTLRHVKESHSTTIAGIPEHFFLDVAEAKVSEVIVQPTGTNINR